MTLCRSFTLSTNTQVPVEFCPKCAQQYAAGTGICPRDGESLMKQMPDPLLGTRLPRNYVITQRLGRGAMSVVYKGVYEPLKQPVAIKLLKSHLVSDLQTFKRFQQESKTAGALEHPHIVGIFDFGVTDQGVPYLVMELLHGQSLAERLRSEKQLPIDVALRLFKQAADALDYTHQRGVIHRDVKPSNILIYEDDDGLQSCKLVDFGIAKMQNYEGNPAANLTQTGEVFGTPLYVSPEQAMGRFLDQRADIYSFGCVMYEAIAGRPPFSGGTAFDVIRMQISEYARPVETWRTDRDLPPSLVHAINRAMIKDPSQRYQLMEELLIDLHRAEIEYAVAREAMEEGQGLLPRSNATPIEGLKVFRRPADLTPPLGAVPPPLVAGGDPGYISSAQVAALKASAARLPAAQRGSLAHMPAVKGKRTPILPFLISTVAGCLTGALMLCFMPHDGSSASSKGEQQQSSGQALSEQARPQQDAKLLDSQLSAMRDQALALYDDHQYKRAEDGLRKVAALAESKQEALGKGLVLADLCMVNIEQHKLKEAFADGTAAVKALDGQRQVPNKDLSFALRGLGTACYYRGDMKRAEELLTRSVALDKGVYGTDNENYAIGLVRLARVLDDEKKSDKAEQMYRQALAVSQKCHQPGDPHLNMRYSALIDFLREQNRPEEAKQLEQQAKEIK